MRVESATPTIPVSFGMYVIYLHFLADVARQSRTPSGVGRSPGLLTPTVSLNCSRNSVQNGSYRRSVRHQSAMMCVRHHRQLSGPTAKSVARGLAPTGISPVGRKSNFNPADTRAMVPGPIGVPYRFLSYIAYVSAFSILYIVPTSYIVTAVPTS